VSAERLVHHELCFGCGRTNLFGLLMDIEPAAPGQVRGRGFIKQDHQGAERGVAHEGILVTVLSEAMALACGADGRATQIEVRLHGQAPVGAFVEVEAAVEDKTDGARHTSATARVDGRVVASARGSYEVSV
jgi:acyl-coenzyme A thioesterase PaaI-like protein